MIGQYVLPFVFLCGGADGGVDPELDQGSTNYGENFRGCSKYPACRGVRVV